MLNRLSIAFVLSLLAVSSTVHAQSAASPAASAAQTPSNLPPGATSSKGDKAATPGKGTAATDPQTGSTPGTAPSVTSAEGNKAQTPKGGTRAPKPHAQKASAPIKEKDGRVEGSRQESEAKPASK